MNVEVRVIVLAVLDANDAWVGKFEVYSFKKGIKTNYNPRIILSQKAHSSVT